VVLSSHALQILQQSLDKYLTGLPVFDRMPNAKVGRTDPNVDVHGMAGIPEDVLAAYMGVDDDDAGQSKRAKLDDPSAPSGGDDPKAGPAGLGAASGGNPGALPPPGGMMGPGGAPAGFNPYAPPSQYPPGPGFPGGPPQGYPGGPPNPYGGPMPGHPGFPFHPHHPPGGFPMRGPPPPGPYGMPQGPPPPTGAGGPPPLPGGYPPHPGMVGRPLFPGAPPQPFMPHPGAPFPGRQPLFPVQPHMSMPAGMGYPNQPNPSEAAGDEQLRHVCCGSSMAAHMAYSTLCVVYRCHYEYARRGWCSER